MSPEYRSTCTWLSLESLESGSASVCKCGDLGRALEFEYVEKNRRMSESNLAYSLQL